MGTVDDAMGNVTQFSDTTEVLSQGIYQCSPVSLFLLSRMM